MHERTWVWRFDAPPEAVWPVLADTARFNEAAGLPRHQIVETPQPDGSVRYTAEARQGPFRLAWREAPVNWVAGRWFEHCRHFTRGPLRTLCATLELEPEEGGTCARYTIRAEAANLLGELALKTRFFKGVDRTFSPIIASTCEYLRGSRDTAFPPAGARIPDTVADRVGSMVDRIEATPHGHGLARRLADFALSGQENDVIKLRPLALARRWGVGAREAVDVCLEATRTGLLELRWDLLCPRCRVAKAAVGSLDQLPEGAHCGTCNIDYARDFSRNVELAFQPAPAIRAVEAGEYCLFGPMSTPHIAVHVTVEPGAVREVDAHLEAGPWRLRTLEAGPECDIEHAGGGFPTVVLGQDAICPGPPAPDGRVRLVNEAAHPRTFVIEAREWVRDALTADRVTTMQTFRDLFSSQVLRPGDEVAIRHVTLMFTDLRGSTALYEAIGDAPAYALVRDHFAMLARVVRAHEGAIVKTIGDAVMAAFAEPANALAAAQEIQRTVAEFNAERSHKVDGRSVVTIKLGLHAGPCIVVTLNERLDYFGTTVNLAARLQGQSRGGDIVLSRTVAEDPAVAPRVADLHGREESAQLRGFEEPIPFLRIDAAAATGDAAR